ncbi:fumarylacetoacetate hydrolase family protein [Paenibacillus sp. IB182496]|uniref:Fumarylacetoacetate hydrolase family protein n=1 Tax=Paenibacillus sabuli TaxID=2772509 RepID=A0A927GQD3_9BACL|nr:fumarylacetoacetate hydrolase family protein [Paenibacillus sabuli]MBD2844156.1 fumarylacetoacetate hydrolase family protein [Paenibacillus sabuli]
MKLASFLVDGQERFGFSLLHPVTGEELLVEPGKAEADIIHYAVSKTSGYQFSVPRFLSPKPWPLTMQGFLELGEGGMDTLGRLVSFTERFVEQSDGFSVLAKAAHRLEDVSLLPPVPEPRVLLGLVGNCPGFSRNHVNIPHINLVPQVHQRHLGSAIGNGEPFVIRRPKGQKVSMSFNAELGVIIGKAGKNIPVEEAMSYVVGYTVVTDTAHGYYNVKYGEMGKHTDPMSIMAYGWTHKNTDISCAVGPYLVTKDEVGHPYDLMLYSRTNGMLRDRANTCSTLVGVERTIAYFSSFMKLLPGDVIHMGANGKDGIGIDVEHQVSGETIQVECEIEKLGVLRNKVTYLDDAELEEKRREFSLAAPMQAEEWDLGKARNFVMTYANTQASALASGCQVSPIPRYLWSVTSALSSSVSYSPDAKDELYVTAEIAVVIGKTVKWADKEKLSDCILGYLPLVSVTDKRLAQQVIHPALPRESAMPEIYARWADGCNRTCDVVTPLSKDELAQMRVFLEIDGEQVMDAQYEDYVCKAEDVIEMIGYGSTLYAGDVLSLGALCAPAVIPGGHAAVRVAMKASGLPDLTLAFHSSQGSARYAKS